VGEVEAVEARFGGVATTGTVGMILIG